METVVVYANREAKMPCGYKPGDCCGICAVCGNNPENNKSEDKDAR
jgi:hypothetical protein